MLNDNVNDALCQIVDEELTVIDVTIATTYDIGPLL